MKFKSRKIYLEYLLWLFLILDCNTVYSELNNITIPFSALACIISVFLVINRILVNNKVQKYSIYCCLLLAFYQLPLIYITFIKTNSLLVYTIKYIFLISILIIYFQIEKARIRCLLYEFSNIVIFLGSVSLVFYILGTLLNILKTTGNLTIYWGSIQTVKTYLYIHFNTQSNNLFNMSFYRNSGIFAEAPMFCLILCLSAAVEILIRKKHKKKNILLLIICIISTFSMTGYIFLLVTLFFYFMMNQEASQIKKAIKIIFIPITFFIVFYGVYYIISIKSNYGLSYSLRLDDFKAGYRAWLNNPIFGNGYNNFTIIKKYMLDYRIRYGITGYSNGIMQVLAYGGIYFGLLYLMSAFISIKTLLSEKKILEVGFVLCVIYLFCVVAWGCSCILITFLALGLSLVSVKNNKLLY